MAKKRGNNEGSITRRPDGRWMAQVTIGHDPATGKPRRATFYGKTRQEVADKLTKALRDKQQGTFIPPHKMTLGEWLDTWLWEYKQPGIRAATLTNYASLVHCHLKPTLGHFALQDLRPEHIQRYVNAKVEQGLAAKTIRLHYVVLSNVLTLAEKHGLVARNICKLVEPPRLPRKERRTLTMAEVTERLLPVLKEDRLSAAYLVLLMMGLRRGELLGVRWQDIDWKTHVLCVKQTLVRVRRFPRRAEEEKQTALVFQEPKTEKSRRTLPLPEACLSALRQHRAHQAEEKLALGPAYQDHDLVFCRPDGGPIDPRTLNRAFHRVLEQARLPRIKLHSTRHTYATWLLEQGESPRVVQELLGHSSVAITLDLYSHVSLELETKAAATLNAAFTGRG